MTQAIQTTEAVRRDRHIYHLVDSHASTEAASALHRVAGRTRDDAGVLAAADAILRDANDAAARDRLGAAVARPEFLSILPNWIRELREVASLWPDSGACTVATALKLWLWTANHLRASDSPAVDELAEALTPLLAARCLALEVTANASETSAELELRRDLSHVYAARASALAGAACAELVFGYRRHLLWDAEGCATCFASDDLDDLEALIPGIASGARTSIDIIEADGSHPAKRGPCASFNGLDTFMRLRNRLDGCLTGSRMAKKRAAEGIARSMDRSA
jgi:hypothetical protein